MCQIIKRQEFVFVVLLLFGNIGGLILAGCGGGGSSGDTLTPLTPPDGRFRMLRVGDTWTYDVTGTYTLLSTGEKTSMKGTLRIDIEPTDIQGALAMKTTLNVSVNGRPLTSVIYEIISQDNDGTIYLLAEITSEEGTDSLQSPIVMYRSPMFIGQVVNWTGLYESGQKTIGSYRVDNMERISIPAGQFVAFKVTKSEKVLKEYLLFGQLITQPIADLTEILWIVPQLGTIKTSGTITYHLDKASLSIITSLKSYYLNP